MNGTTSHTTTPPGWRRTTGTPPESTARTTGQRRAQHTPAAQRQDISCRAEDRTRINTTTPEGPSLAARALGDHIVHPRPSPGGNGAASNRRA
ncbi:hypothetical protein [Micromonospora pisi]|uniref:hypothetical protein n=1 Tax=Micromonospora pisi TaxID=589240 RepID=UPI000EAB545F|nr:hypothetical protein [Micromonospora pisi]